METTLTLRKFDKGKLDQLKEYFKVNTYSKAIEFSIKYILGEVNDFKELQKKYDKSLNDLKKLQRDYRELKDLLIQRKELDLKLKQVLQNALF